MVLWRGFTPLTIPSSGQANRIDVLEIDTNGSFPRLGLWFSLFAHTEISSFVAVPLSAHIAMAT
jgi:hypothetical protein